MLTQPLTELELELGLSLAIRGGVKNARKEQRGGSLNIKIDRDFGSWLHRIRGGGGLLNFVIF